MREQSLIEAVTAELQRLGQAENVRVAAADGVVTLTGQVRGPEERTIVEQEILRLPQVADVRNQLEIPLPAGDLREQLLALLAREGVRAGEMGIEAERGVVTLRGHADGWFDRDAAERLAWSLPGVRQVVNEVSLPPDALDADLEPGIGDGL